MLAVELRPEETRCRLQDLVRSAKLLHLTLEILDPGPLIGRQSWTEACVGLRFANPLPQALVVDLQLRCDRLHRLPLRWVLVLVIQHHPDCPLSELRRIRPARCSLVVWHRSILSKEGAVTIPGAIHLCIARVSAPLQSD